MLKASDRAKQQNDVLKPYNKPSLVKGPVLSTVTAEPTLSVIPSDQQT
jgi:hypothetical protein